jgi:hypothetical protein
MGGFVGAGEAEALARWQKGKHILNILLST